MSDDLVKHHVLEPFLAAHRGGDADTQLEVRSQHGYVNLRGDSGSDSLVAQAEHALGQLLPVAANTISRGAHTIYWLGPDEWLVQTAAHAAHSVTALLRDLAADSLSTATDLSGGFIALRLSGARARDVLAKGCTLDLHPREFAIDQCAQSGLAKALILLGMADAAPTYDIIVRRSFAEYTALWLHHAAVEYGIAIGEAPLA